MNQSEPKPKADAAMHCFACEAGTLLCERRDHTFQHPKLGECTIPAVPVWVCDTCDERSIGDEGNRLIDDYLDQALNVVSPEEIQRLLSKYNLTQKQASQITGLGEKNISRWASGRARPSESVSNFLRLLMADEAAFERLRQKNFTAVRPQVSYPTMECAPAPEEKKILKLVDYAGLVKAGVVAKTGKAAEKRTHLCRRFKCGDLLEFEQAMTAQMERLAAFKDTRQKANPVSGGMWVYLGEVAAEKIETAPYSREKLRSAVVQLRSLTTQPLSETAPVVQSILAEAGVALVFIPPLKESAMRGCTRLLTSNKAVIVHGLKYRSLAQFWVILFHEIAHLLLHLSKPGEAIPEYEDAASDLRENQADEWAFDTLASRDAELEFLANHQHPNMWQMVNYAQSIQLHPAIAAEVLNRRSGREVISYAYLKKSGFFPHISKAETESLMETSRV
jgi:HTH-type transcriptional regulator/antitoxin HigA